MPTYIEKTMRDTVDDNCAILDLIDAHSYPLIDQYNAIIDYYSIMGDYINE